MVCPPSNDHTLVDALAAGYDAEDRLAPVLPLLQQLYTLCHRRQLVRLARHIAVVAGLQLPGGEFKQRAEVKADKATAGPARKLTIWPAAAARNFRLLRVDLKTETRNNDVQFSVKCRII